MKNKIYEALKNGKLNDDQLLVASMVLEKHMNAIGDQIEKEISQCDLTEGERDKIFKKTLRKCTK